MADRRGFKRPVIACYECGFTQPDDPDMSCDSTRCVNCGGGLEEVPERLVRIIEELEEMVESDSTGVEP